MKIKIAAVTDVGIERDNNEDSFVICQDLEAQEWQREDMARYIPIGRYGALLVVADGMGGTNAGEVASLIATETVRGIFSKENISEYIAKKQMHDLLRNAFEMADNAIKKGVEEDPNTIGMGSTLVICWVMKNSVHVAWCGDSRCYVYNSSEGLKALTKDHSYVQELIDQGIISEKQAFLHPDNNIITRCIGDADTIASPDITECMIKPHDVLLLCSDGLCGYCDNQSIEDILNRYCSNIIKCKDELLKIALNAGGHDNISIVLASLVDKEKECFLKAITKKWFFELFRRK